MEKKVFTISFSLIIPVFNRPDEIKELLKSLALQTNKEFEVIIVEDGSTLTCMSVTKEFGHLIDIKYFFKNNSGPGLSRNFGYEKANGNYCIFLDSDCILPPNYFQAVRQSLENNYTDAFGGPDESHEKFSFLQKAINYSMTSFFTTGGIRGKSEKLRKFHPRSFNMGFSREVFNATHGFSKMRYGEDIDLSIRITKMGFKTKLIKEAFVYHKRRNNLKQFFNQVFNFGRARIRLIKLHPKYLSVIHTIPSLFTIGVLLLILLSVHSSLFFLIPIGFYALILLIHSTMKNKKLSIGILSVLTSFTQIFAYGFGYIWELINYKF